jgi:hypothetical protein
MGVEALPPVPTAGGGGCDEVPLHPTSSYPDKEQQAFKLSLSAFKGEEGIVLVGGDVPERIFVVVSKVDLDSTRTGSVKMERCGGEDTHLIAKQPEMRDKAPNADAAIRRNVEHPPVSRLAEATMLLCRVCGV